MKTKIKKILNDNKVAVLSSVTACSAMIPSIVHAESVSVADTITSSFQTIVTDTISSIAAIAPIGITIFGAMFAWKKGKQFFNTVSK